MPTANIKYIEDKAGNVFFPVTHQGAVIDDNGIALNSTLAAKQDKLSAGSNVTITNNVISATGTVTGVKMNNITNSPSSGIVDLGTVITSHQDISGKANLASPTFTGTPTAPTAAAGTNTTQIATTAFVQNAIPTVNDSTISIQKGGTAVDSFTTNASSGKTINIPNELPSYSSSDSGKILSVNSSGALVWITPSYVYSGSSAPSNSIGNNGDIYLQTS